MLMHVMTSLWHLNFLINMCMWNQISWSDAWKILNCTLAYKTCARQIDFKHDVKCKSAFKSLNHISS